MISDPTSHRSCMSGDSDTGRRFLMRTRASKRTAAFWVYGWLCLCASRLLSGSATFWDVRPCNTTDGGVILPLNIRTHNVDRVQICDGEHETLTSSAHAHPTLNCTTGSFYLLHGIPVCVACSGIGWRDVALPKTPGYYPLKIFHEHKVSPSFLTAGAVKRQTRVLSTIFHLDLPWCSLLRKGKTTTRS